MKYVFVCGEHGPLEIVAPIDKGPPPVVYCPLCSSVTKRDYRMSGIIYGEGFSGDYFKTNPGRGQPWDKKEWLNKNWSDYYGEKPPKPDSKGTYE